VVEKRGRKLITPRTAHKEGMRKHHRNLNNRNGRGLEKAFENSGILTM
jgi:hypothetical protein